MYAKLKGMRDLVRWRSMLFIGPFKYLSQSMQELTLIARTDIKIKGASRDRRSNTCWGSEAIANRSVSLDSSRARLGTDADKMSADQQESVERRQKRGPLMLPSISRLSSASSFVRWVA